MREFTKSALSFSWAVSLLGMKQAFNLLNWGNRSQVQRDGRLFDVVTDAAVGQLDESMKGIFRTVDNMQSRIVDMVFASFDAGNWNVMKWAGNCGRPTGDSVKPRDSADPPPDAVGPPSVRPAASGCASGWGPMPDETPP